MTNGYWKTLTRTLKAEKTIAWKYILKDDSNLDESIEFRRAVNISNDVADTMSAGSAFHVLKVLAIIAEAHNDLQSLSWCPCVTEESASCKNMRQSISTTTCNILMTY